MNKLSKFIADHSKMTKTEILEQNLKNYNN